MKISTLEAECDDQIQLKILNFGSDLNSNYNIANMKSITRDKST